MIGFTMFGMDVGEGQVRVSREARVGIRWRAEWSRWSGVRERMRDLVSAGVGIWPKKRVARPLLRAICSLLSEATMSWPRYCFFAASRARCVRGVVAIF